MSYGMLCGAAGVCLNALLFVFKVLAGRLSGSIAVTADAFNNLSDAGSSLVTLAGFRLAGHKADSKHPFGHGRIEYVSGLVVSLIILLMGAELLEASIEKILSPQAVVFSWKTALVLVASILVKLYMFLYNRDVGKRIGSAAMGATALDSLSDMAATAVVLCCMFIGKWSGVYIDGYAGVGVALFILFSGFQAAKETISPLLGEPPTREFVERIEQLVLSDPNVVGVHDLVVHNYGTGRTMISLHAEVPAEGDLIHLHDAVDNLEKKLRGLLGCSAVIHMDPVATNDAETLALKAQVEAIAVAVDPRLSIHDFRMVPGPTHTNLVFDVVAPYGLSIGDDEVARRISQKVAALDPRYFTVIEVDKTSVK